MSENSSNPPGTTCSVPSWQRPLSRFIEGEGELCQEADGPVFTLWEAYLYFDASDYPLLLDGDQIDELDVDLWIAKHLLGEEPNEGFYRLDREMRQQLLELMIAKGANTDELLPLDHPAGEGEV